MVEVLEKDESMPLSASYLHYKPKFTKSFGYVFKAFDKKMLFSG